MLCFLCRTTMPTTKTRKKRKKPAKKRTIEEIAVALAANQKPTIITKAISESAGRFKTGRYEA